VVRKRQCYFTQGQLYVLCITQGQLYVLYICPNMRTVLPTVGRTLWWYAHDCSLAALSTGQIRFLPPAAFESCVRTGLHVKADGPASASTPVPALTDARYPLYIRGKKKIECFLSLSLRVTTLTLRNPMAWTCSCRTGTVPCCRTALASQWPVPRPRSRARMMFVCARSERFFDVCRLPPPQRIPFV